MHFYSAVSESYLVRSQKGQLGRKTLTKTLNTFLPWSLLFGFFLNYNDDKSNHFNLNLILQLMHFHLIFQLFLIFLDLCKKCTFNTMYAAKLFFQVIFCVVPGVELCQKSLTCGSFGEEGCGLR